MSTDSSITAMVDITLLKRYLDTGMALLSDVAMRLWKFCSVGLSVIRFGG